MTTRPLVSVVTPSLNQGNYIEETIKSVLHQDYSNLEHIVIDGGSSDNTLNILKKYNTPIRWVSEPDKGQADAINKGMEIARGEIVAWLNSDDILLPEAIRSVVEVFQSDSDVKMVYGKSHFIDATGKLVGNYPTEPFDFERLPVFNFVSQPSAFVTKETFYHVGGLDPSLQYALDLDLWIRMGKEFPIEYLPEFLSCYRLHAASKTVDNLHALCNHKESLDIALKHYHWAPLNKVYGYCYHVVLLNLRQPLGKLAPLTTALSLLLTIVKYIQLNRGVRHRDIEALNVENLKKLCMPRDTLYQSY